MVNVNIIKNAHQITLDQVWPTNLFFTAYWAGIYRQAFINSKIHKTKNICVEYNYEENKWEITGTAPNGRYRINDPKNFLIYNYFQKKEDKLLKKHFLPK
jgi:hypothetical protein